MLLTSLLSDPRALVVFVVAMIIAITVHEFSHALLAYRLGDSTARSLGRLSLNPLAHLDPVGTIMLLIAGFGWGKPVPVNPYALRNGPKSGMMIVSLAGPLSNFLVASLVALPIRLDLIDLSTFGGRGLDVAMLLGRIIQLNILLGVFNLLPIAPLDGFKVLVGLLPRNAAVSFAKTEPYGMMILLGIIALEFLTRVSILWAIIGPPYSFLYRIFLGG